MIKMGKLFYLGKSKSGIPVYITPGLYKACEHRTEKYRDVYEQTEKEIKGVHYIIIVYEVKDGKPKKVEEFILMSDGDLQWASERYKRYKEFKEERAAEKKEKAPRKPKEPKEPKEGKKRREPRQRVEKPLVLQEGDKETILELIKVISTIRKIKEKDIEKNLETLRSRYKKGSKKIAEYKNKFYFFISQNEEKKTLDIIAIKKIAEEYVKKYESPLWKIVKVASGNKIIESLH